MSRSVEVPINTADTTSDVDVEMLFDDRLIRTMIIENENRVAVNHNETYLHSYWHCVFVRRSYNF